MKMKTISKGRDINLIKRRDLKLLIRFHQLTEIQHQRFEYVIRILSMDEFFISEQRIWCIIRQNIKLLNKIKQLVDSPNPEDALEYMKLFN